MDVTCKDKYTSRRRIRVNLGDLNIKQFIPLNSRIICSDDFSADLLISFFEGFLPPGRGSLFPSESTFPVLIWINQ